MDLILGKRTPLCTTDESIPLDWSCIGVLWWHKTATKLSKKLGLQEVDVIMSNCYRKGGLCFWANWENWWCVMEGGRGHFMRYSHNWFGLGWPFLRSWFNQFLHPHKHYIRAAGKTNTHTHFLYKGLKNRPRCLQSNHKRQEEKQTYRDVLNAEQPTSIGKKYPCSWQ